MLLSPLAGPGGKAKQYDVLQKYLPTHIHTFIDAFTGGGSVCLNVIKEKNPAAVIMNDLDSNLINFGGTVQNNVPMFLNMNGFFDKTEENFEALKKTIPTLPDPVQFLLNNKLKFNGLHNSSYTFLRYKQNGSPAVFNRIKQSSKLLNNVLILNKNVFELILNPQLRDDPNIVGYFDPPYFEKEGYTKNFFEGDNFFKALKDIKGYGLLSINDHPVIRDFIRIYNFTCNLEMGGYSMTNHGQAKPTRIGLELMVYKKYG